MTRIEIFEPSEGYRQVMALVQANKSEAEAHIPFAVDVDVQLYDRLYQAGLLVLLGAYEGARMVGYAIASVAPHLHYGVLVGQHMTLYIAPEHRTPRLSLRLVEALAAQCKAKGARMMTWHAKPDSAFARLLSKRFKVEDLVYLQEL